MENLVYELVRPSAATSLDARLTRIQIINDARIGGLSANLRKIFQSMDRPCPPRSDPWIPKDRPKPRYPDLQATF